jgi:cobalt-zinc-cadmium efflux system protein
MSHSPHQHDHHAPPDFTNAFIIGIVLNLGFVVVEVIGGLWTHSLSLLTDAGHNLGDVASLILALFAAKLALKKTNDQFSFGYRQSTILVALLNGGILLFALGAIAYEAIIRIGKTHPIEGADVAIVAGIGILINSVTAFLFMRGKEKDLNVKGAYLHMLSDALVSAGVVVSGIVIYYTHWYWLDTAVSLIIVAIVVWSTWDLFKESLKLSLNGVPTDININEVKNYLLDIKGVTDVHDLHIWAISTTETALTAHLVIPGALETDNIYGNIEEELFHRYNITHSTIQIERHDGSFHCEQKC